MIVEPDLFEPAFRHAAIGMALVSLQGRFLKVNDALCRLLGYEREELLATDFQTITHPDDLHGDLALVRRLVDGEMESYDLEKRYLRKDGKTVWAAITVTLARDGAGAPRFFIGQIQDLGARKRAESELESFFETSPDLLAILGEGGRFVRLNRAWETTLGYDRAELASRTIVELLPPEDASRNRELAERLHRGEAVRGARYRFRHRDGHTLWVEWNASRHGDGQIFCVGRDVTARVVEETRLAWLAAVVEHAEDAIVGFDARGIVFSANRGVEALYGYTPAELIGQHVTFVAHDEQSRADIEAMLERALAGKPLQEYDAVRHRRDGSSIDVHVYVRRVEDDQGGVLGWSINARDITERQRLTAALAYQADIYAAIARSLPRGTVSVFDSELTLVAIEGAELLTALGISRWELIGRPLLDMAVPENRERLLTAYRRALAGESTEMLLERGGLSLLARVAPLQDSIGTITGGLILSLDVTEQRRQTSELRQAKLLLDAVIANMVDGVVLLDGQRRILLANDAFARLFGFDRAALPGLPGLDYLRLVESRFDEESRARLGQRLHGGNDVETSVVDDLTMIEPERRILQRTIRKVGAGAGVGGYLVVWRDITVERELLALRDREAYTDVLTGVANRRAADAALREAMANSARTRQPLSVALFDIDHFKRVNDRHGHAVGDQVITAVAGVLAGQARSTDFVARWGGEEFIAILPGTRAGALLFCARVLAAVRALDIAEVGRVTISAGVAENGDAPTIGELLERADARLYEAKSGGRDRAVG